MGLAVLSVKHAGPVLFPFLEACILISMWLEALW